MSTTTWSIPASPNSPRGATSVGAGAGAQADTIDDIAPAPATPATAAAEPFRNPRRSTMAGG